MSRRYKPYRRETKRSFVNTKQEEEGIILEILDPSNNRKRGKYAEASIIQVVGTAWFTLLEIVPKDVNLLSLGDKIKIDKNEDNNIESIIGRVSFDDLTRVAELQFNDSFDKMIDDREAWYVNWLNKAMPISLRYHSLNLIDGIGPKYLKKILAVRKENEFLSFDDFENRTGISNIKNLIKDRVMTELTDDTEKYNVFTRRNPNQRQDRR